MILYIHFLVCKAYFYLLERLCNELMLYCAQQRPVFKDLRSLKYKIPVDFCISLESPVSSVAPSGCSLSINKTGEKL